MNPQAGSLAHRAGIGARWAVLQSAGKHGIDLLVFLCLARWVAPDAFGLVATANALVVLVTVLAELGLGDALVQRAQLGREQADTAFWCALGCGVLAAALLAAFAPVARQFGHGELAAVLWGMCPLFIFNSLTVVPQALLQRDMAFRPLALRALAGSCIGGLAGLVLAWHGAGAASLVVLQLTSAAVGTAGLWLATRWRPGLHFCRETALQLFAFGRHVMGTRALNVLASKADDLAVGLLLGPLALGYYSVACRLLLALEQLFSQGIDAVALSAFSRAGEAREAVARLYLAAVRIAAMWAVPVFGLGILLAPDLISLAVGPAWLPSAPLLQILLPAGLLHALMHFNHAVFKARGQPELSMRIAVSSTALNVVTLAVAVKFGTTAVAISYLARSALISPFGVRLACRLVGVNVGEYARGLVRPAACTLAAAAAAGLALAAWPALSDHATPDWLRLALLSALGAAAYLLAARASTAPPSTRIALP